MRAESGWEKDWPSSNGYKLRVRLEELEIGLGEGAGEEI